MSTTRLYLYIDVTGDRFAVLDWRNEIIEKLGELGIRLSMTDDRTHVYLVDPEIPTLGDRLTR